MKVLHFIPSFVGGGAERQLALLALELCQLGVETHVAFVHSGRNLESLRNSPVTLHPVACRGNHDPSILVTLLRLVRRIQPDVIQTWLPQMDTFGGVTAKLAGVPFVLSERSSAMAYPPHWKNLLRQFVGRRATAVVANSEGGARYWRSRVRSEVVHVIRNGLPLARIRSATPADPLSIGLPENVRVILSAGRLNAEKNVETFLHAMESLLVSRPDCAALVFGEGPLRALLLARIESMQVRTRLRLLGFTSELWRWMRRASVFVSLSSFEGSPNTVLESMAAGCTVMVSDIPAHREFLNESMAWFCDFGSVSSVSTAIGAVLDDPGRAAIRATAAYALASTWSIEAAAKQYARLYGELAIDGHARL